MLYILVETVSDFGVLVVCDGVVIVAIYRVALVEGVFVVLLKKMVQIGVLFLSPSIERFVSDLYA
jgi:hypothetical protein